MSATTAALFPIVYKYLKEQGLDSTAKKLLKEAKLDAKTSAAASGDLSAIYKSFSAQLAAAKKKPAPKAADSSSSSSSDSDSDSDDDTDTAKKAAVVVKKKVVAKKADSSSSSSDSSSDSEDEAPAPKKVVAKPVAKPVAKKAAKADSSSSSSSDSDSDDEDEKPKAPVAKKAKAVAAPKKADSSSSSSDSDSDSDDEDVAMKEAPKVVAKKAVKKDSSSDSDSDSDSDDEMVVHKRKREEDSVASTPSKAAKTTATSTPAASGDPKVVRVSGMPYESTNDSITAFFKDCGTITNIDMPLWEDSGRSKGFANLTFTDESQAQKCIAMNGATMGERWLKIEPYAEKPKRTYDNTPSEKPDGCTCVFVGNLSYDIDEEAMKAAFKDCGEVTNIRWGMDRETGDFKGFGHVEFANTESTDKAVAMAGEMVLGRAIRVDFAKGSKSPRSGGKPDARGYGPQSEKPAGCSTLFIGNLSFNIDEDSVWTFFGEMGEVARVKLATDRETGEYRGFGHVEFTEEASADKAVAELAGKKLCGREVRLDWAKGRD